MIVCRAAGSRMKGRRTTPWLPGGPRPLRATHCSPAQVKLGAADPDATRPRRFSTLQARGRPGLGDFQSMGPAARGTGTRGRMRPAAHGGWGGVGAGFSGRAGRVGGGCIVRWGRVHRPNSAGARLGRGSVTRRWRRGTGAGMAGHPYGAPCLAIGVRGAASRAGERGGKAGDGRAVAGRAPGRKAVQVYRDGQQGGRGDWGGQGARRPQARRAPALGAVLALVAGALAASAHAMRRAWG
jgi:hypothetical protein